jgi:hypothetical protein
VPSLFVVTVASNEPPTTPAVGRFVIVGVLGVIGAKVVVVVDVVVVDVVVVDVVVVEVVVVDVVVVVVVVVVDVVVVVVVVVAWAAATLKL